ncbi:MAG: efflux RND transporter periplasmic adaptor subunit [Glaciimonas sp.]|nr:efflux RND transporter periplasmic adaptor subunit [Glaciimonas sp.]
MKLKLNSALLFTPHLSYAEWTLSLCTIFSILFSVQCFAQTGPSRVGAKPDGNFACVIEPSLEINLGMPVDGVLEIIKADRGDVVIKGQLLARLYSGVETATVEHQSEKAAFGARKLMRNKEMEVKNLISSQELDEISTEQKLAEHELKERQEHLKLRSLVSPIRGVVVDRFKSQGDLVKQEKIFMVAQLDPLHVETVVPASFFGKMSMGQLIDVRPQFSGTAMKARISSIDRVIDSASNTFRVRLILANPRFEIPSGQRCFIQF